MYNRNINRLTAVIQSPIAPRSTNVLWDDLVSNTLKVYRKGIWTVIGGAGGGGEGSSLYWGYDEIQGVIFPLDNRSVQINGDLTVNGDITARKLSVSELEIDGKPFEQYWELDSNTNTLSTTYKVLIKNSLIVEEDASSGGDGQDTPGGSGGVSEEDVLDILKKNNYITSSALSSYYTKTQSDARYLASSLLGSNTLIHSGNIGSQSVASAKSLVASDGTTYVSYNATYGQVIVKGINIGYGGNTIETASGGVLNIQANSTGGTIISPYGGNVLIGTATDDTSHKVQVDGALKVYETSQRRLYTRINSAGVQLGVDTSLYTGGWNGGVTVGADNSSIGFVAGAYLEGGTLYKLFYGGTSFSNASIVINGLGGNVGIGTTSPLSKLQVDGQINLSAGTNNNYSFIRSENYSSNISLLRIGTCYGYSSEASAITIYNGCVGIGKDIPQYELDVNGTARVSGYAESAYNRNTGMSSTMFFTSTQWLRIWKGTYGSAVRLQIGKNYYHMDPMVLCVDVSVGYSSAAISVTCNADAANMAIQAIRVTKDASGNYNIDVLIYNTVVNTDTFCVYGNSAGGHILAFETADNTATVLEQVSVVPNASIISNNLIVAGDVASA